MRKIQIIGLALVAVLALSAFAASSAFAEEWLAKGEKITVALASETSGELEMTTLVLGLVGATILCSEIFDGTVGPGKLDTITELLNLEKVLITELALTGEVPLDCTVTAGSGCPTIGGLAEVFPVNLYLDTAGNPTSWSTEIKLVAGVFLDILSGLGAVLGEPGYEVLCGTITTDENGELLGSVENRCIGLVSPNQGNSTLTNEAADVLGTFNSATAEETACTTGNGMLKGSGLTTVNSGEALQVS